MTRDPLGEAGGINLYGFCLNDPVNAVDPLGLMGFAGAVSDAEKTGTLVRELGKMENAAWKKKDADRAMYINSIIKDLQKKGLKETMKIIENAPAGTTVSGTPPTTKAEIALEILKEIQKILESFEKDNSCKRK